MFNKGLAFVKSFFDLVPSNIFTGSGDDVGSYKLVRVFHGMAGDRGWDQVVTGFDVLTMVSDPEITVTDRHDQFGVVNSVGLVTFQFRQVDAHDFWIIGFGRFSNAVEEFGVGVVMQVFVFVS